MAFKQIGKTFKNKTGKSGTLILSENDLEVLKEAMEPHEKYGKQVRLIISGTPTSEYGYSVSLIVEKKEDSVSSDDLPFN